MKNIPFPEGGYNCPDCNLNIYALLTLNGMDFTTCPICNYTNINNPDSLGGFYFCEQCHIIYDGGCVHSYSDKMKDSIFYGRLIESYTFLDEYYIGMPQFESIEECQRLLADLSLNWKCMCNLACQKCPVALRQEDLYYECYCLENEPQFDEFVNNITYVKHKTI